MSKARTGWLPRDADLSDLRQHATLDRLVQWLAFPAVLRTVRAHSDRWGDVFEQGDLGALHAGLGRPAWTWARQAERLVPSLQAACAGGKLDWLLLNTLWCNGAVAAETCFYHHTGCHGISPPGAARLPFDHPAYGCRQGAEALMFFGGGLALIGRAKVFYDEPRGFGEALARSESFGAAWARYFELESQAATWGQVGGDIGRKRSYFWSVIGDGTLRLASRAPGR